jgi:hypothetical protein
VERDGIFITGQNPFSSKSLAEVVMATLQHQFPPQLNVGPAALAPVQIVAEFPAPTFLENLTVSPAGTLFVSSLEEGVVYQILPEKREFAHLPVVAGLAWWEQSLLAVSTNPTAPGLYRLVAGAEPELVVSIPEAKLLNGLLHLSGSRFLIADSYGSCIWVADVATGQAQIWLQHPFLAHAADPFHPVPQFPGVNGLKRFGDTLFASSTEQQKLITIPLQADGSAGEPQVFMTLINLDDFAFDLEGNLYGTTHIYNSVVRITPDRQITVIAGLAEGAAGTTAVAFGRIAEDQMSLYVTTNGGMSSPPPGGVQPGRVLRIETGKAGYFREEE